MSQTILSADFQQMILLLWMVCTGIITLTHFKILLQNIILQYFSHSLLDLLFSGTESNESVEQRVVRCLLAQGFGRDLLDGRSPYLIFTLLECLNVESNSSYAACIVRQDLIFQLLSEGQWAWAVFIALQINDTDVR